MWQNMQSKGKKPYLAIIGLVVVVLIAVSFFHEPKLVQSPVEQALDASSFSK